MGAPPEPTFDRAMLRQLCELSRLNVPAELEVEVLGRLQRVVSAFQALGELSSGPDLAPTARPDGVPLRPDEAVAPLPLATVLANAPKQAADCFLVPRVVDA